MLERLPDWFAADYVCAASDGWYVGAENGFRVGPFASEDQARRHSRELTARLLRCRNTTEMVRVVRRFLHDQLHGQRRLLRNGAGAPAETAADGDRSRAGEAPRVRFRTDRVFAVGEKWYFSTREGIHVGPFPSRAVARSAAAELLAELRHVPPGAAAALAIERFQARLRSD